MGGLIGISVSSSFPGLENYFLPAASAGSNDVVLSPQINRTPFPSTPQEQIGQSFPPPDSVSFSPESIAAARTLIRQENQQARGLEEGLIPTSARALLGNTIEDRPEEELPEAETSPANPQGLTNEEKQEVQKLKQRDTEVRQHEQAHVAAGGQYVRGGPQFEYEQGPDGRRYAVGGEVDIDVSAAGTPEASIAKAQVVRRAALAPPEPSGQDRQIAAQASQLETKARKELAEQKAEEAAAAREESGNPLAPPNVQAAFQAEGINPPEIEPHTPSGPQKLDLII